MGFFSKMKNFVTGGAAKVSLIVIDAKVNEPFHVKITVKVDESDIEIDKVYLCVKSIEQTRVLNVEVHTNEGAKRKDVTGSEDSFERKEYTIAGPQTLKAGETYEFEGDVTLGSGAQPTFRGKYCSHEWSMFGGLDMKGNDPDSGWETVEVK